MADNLLILHTASLSSVLKMHSSSEIVSGPEEITIRLNTLYQAQNEVL